MKTTAMEKNAILMSKIFCFLVFIVFNLTLV